MGKKVLVKLQDRDGFVTDIAVAGHEARPVAMITQRRQDETAAEASQLLIEKTEMDEFIFGMVALRNMAVLGARGRLYSLDDRFVFSLVGTEGDTWNMMCVCDKAILDLEKRATSVYGMKYYVGQTYNLHKDMFLHAEDDELIKADPMAFRIGVSRHDSRTYGD